MHRWTRLLTATALCGLLLLVGQANAQEGDPAAQLYILVNQARAEQGLAPYYHLDALSAAAQRHADDMAANTLSSTTGSDGSTFTQRIAEAGYLAWGNGSMVAESFWVGSGSPQDVIAALLEDPQGQANILSEQFREIGIGIASDDTGRSAYVLDFGARPNVLPIFINDGAETTRSPEIAIRLTNEEANPQGEGAIFMGRAIEVRVSNSPDFDDQPWRQWEPRIEWTLPAEPGEHTVYVQFRDGGGRTAASTSSIVLLPGEGTPLPPTATPLPSASPPSPTPTSSSAPPAPGQPPTQPTLTLNQPSLPSPAPPPTWTPLPPPPSVEASSGPSDWLGWLCGLQAAAALLAAYAIWARHAATPSSPARSQ